MSSSIGDTQTLAHTLPVVAAAVWARGDPNAAVMLAAADDALCRAHRFELDSFEREMAGETTEATRRVLGDEFEQVWQAGTKLDVEAAVELALSSLGP
jgi:hypothetical protein